MSDTDDRLLLLTVTGVTSDPDFRHATVLFASLSDDAKAALTEVRLRLQALIASQVRLKRTPQLAFAIDPAVSTGQRVEEILRLILTAMRRPANRGFKMSSSQPEGGQASGPDTNPAVGGAVSGAIAEAARLISGAAQLSLACHVSPDGDALGSMLALHHLALANGKPSLASWPEPFVVAPHYPSSPASTWSPSLPISRRTRADDHLRLRLARPPRGVGPIAERSRRRAG